MSKKLVIEYDAECTSCGGTGLYSGMGEHDGAAVVCHTCRGTGCNHVCESYTPFIKRKEKKGVKQVYQTNSGIFIGEKEGVCKLEDFGGMSVSDWRKGKKFTRGMEDRKHTCPAWWYQCTDYRLKPDWNACNTNFGGRFSECKFFKEKEKEKCWERFDLEHPRLK